MLRLITITCVLFLMLQTCAVFAEEAQTECYKKYSPAKALKLSALTTAAGVGISAGVIGLGIGMDSPALFSFGVITGSLFWIIGPSTGHFYAKNKVQAWLNLSLRGVLVTGAVLGSMGLIVHSFFNMSPPDENTNDEYKLLTIFTISMASGALGLALFDIFTAKRAARRANKRDCDEMKISLFPSVLSTGRKGSTPGLIFAASF